MNTKKDPNINFFTGKHYEHNYKLTPADIINEQHKRKRPFKKFRSLSQYEKGIEPENGIKIKEYIKHGQIYATLWIIIDEQLTKAKVTVPIHKYKGNYTLRLYKNLRVVSDRDSILLKKNFPEIYRSISKELDIWIKTKGTKGVC